MPDKLGQVTQTLLEKKAEELLLLDLRDAASFTDYFLICHGTSRRHVQAVADHVIDVLEKRGEPPLGREGYTEANWVLIDAGDIIVHIFSREKRAYYQLEKLWGNVPLTKFEDTSQNEDNPSPLDSI